MYISIITVCYNSVKTIKKTVESVVSQNNIVMEYIIIDGNSTDGTLKIIKEYANKYPTIIKWKSEPDNGMYDAMNKGIKIANGDIIGILNSDDYYALSNVLALVVDVMSKKNIDSCYGNLLYIKNNKPYRFWKAGERESFKFGWMPPHPSFFVRRNIYEKYGLFRLDCGVNADYELMLRFLEVYNISTKWIDYTFVYMNTGGKSNKDLQSRMDAIINDKMAWTVNNIKPNMFTFLIKRLRKIPQYFGVIFYKYTSCISNLGAT